MTHTHTQITHYTLWLTGMPSQKLPRSHLGHQTPWGELSSGDSQPCSILAMNNPSEKPFHTPSFPLQNLYKYFVSVVFEWQSKWVSSFVSTITAPCLKLLFQAGRAGPLFFKDVISWDPLLCELTATAGASLLIVFFRGTNIQPFLSNSGRLCLFTLLNGKNSLWRRHPWCCAGMAGAVGRGVGSLLDP